MSIFKPSQKTFSPLVNDNEQGPSEGGGGVGEREIDNILLRGKMIFLLSCKQIFDS